MASWQSYVDFMISKGNLQDVLILDSSDGYTWGSTENFDLREYSAMIQQEDGTEVEQTVNEAENLIKLMAGGAKPSQGLRLNGGKKQQIIRSFNDEETKNLIVLGKIMKGGCCIAAAGKAILVGTFDELKGHTSAGCNEVIILMARHLIRLPWPESSSSGSSVGKESWQSYIDVLLIGKGNVSDAIICSADTGEIWASTADFSLKKYEAEIVQEDGTDVTQTVDETKNLLQLMAGGSKPAQGLRLNGDKKYQIVRAFNDDEIGSFVVYGKKVKGGCCIAKSAKAIIVAVFDELKNHTSAGCNDAVGNVIKYLKSVNS